jgi:hypothetical protein
MPGSLTIRATDPPPVEVSVEGDRVVFRLQLTLGKASIVCRSFDDVIAAVRTLGTVRVSIAEAT